MSRTVSLQVHEPQNFDQRKNKFAIQQYTYVKAVCATEWDSSVSITRSSTSQPVNYKEERLICGKARTTKGENPSFWSPL